MPRQFRTQTSQGGNFASIADSDYVNARLLNVVNTAENSAVPTGAGWDLKEKVCVIMPSGGDVYHAFDSVAVPATTDITDGTGGNKTPSGGFRVIYLRASGITNISVVSDTVNCKVALHWYVL